MSLDSGLTRSATSPWVQAIVFLACPVLLCALIRLAFFLSAVSEAVAGLESVWLDWVIACIVGFAGGAVLRIVVPRFVWARRFWLVATAWACIFAATTAAFIWLAKSSAGGPDGPMPSVDWVIHCATFVSAYGVALPVAFAGGLAFKRGPAGG